MRVPVELTKAFEKPFEELIAAFAAEQGLIPDAASLNSPRFLARSVVPHIERLSALFNRIEPTAESGDEDETPIQRKPPKPVKPAEEDDEGLRRYWKESSNPAHLRLAYFLYFMPCNLYRMASVWAELARLGFRWNAGETLRGVEFGAGPAAGVCGVASAQKWAPLGLPRTGNWALIEQDRSMLELGQNWAQTYFADQGVGDWGLRPFHRTLDLRQGFLPRSAPKFNAWLMSYFLNELPHKPEEIARALVAAWERHLENEGVAVMIEPALKAQSRKLLEIRKAILKERERKGYDWLKIALPCLGHQSCGALANVKDWCHEEVSWWRPPYFRVLDQMAELDRKSLPFSYLVVVRSDRSLEEIFPALAGVSSGARYRLVSPAHAEGKEQEFFICGEEGKRRARYRALHPEDPGAELDRGDILLGADVRGDAQASRVERIARVPR